MEPNTPRARHCTSELSSGLGLGLSLGQRTVQSVTFGAAKCDEDGRVDLDLVLGLGSGLGLGERTEQSVTFGAAQCDEDGACGLRCLGPFV